MHLVCTVYRLPGDFVIAMVAQLFVIPGFYIKKCGYDEMKTILVSGMLSLFVGFIVAFYLNGKPAMAVGNYKDLFLFWVAAGVAQLSVSVRPR